MAEESQGDLLDLLQEQDENTPENVLQLGRDILKEVQVGSNLKEVRTDSTSNTRSIHDKESIDFYKRELAADKWVVDQLENYHKIPFTSKPPKYLEKNNKSATEEKEILWDTMQKWQKCGYVTEVSEAPTCVNPMSVVTQPDSRNHKIKKRPCLDLSRHVNKFIVESPMKISHLSAVENTLLEGDYQTLYDLENMFFQVKVSKEDRQYLGCRIEDDKGLFHYFEFNVLIYGLKHAVNTVTKLTKPIVNRLNKEGIRNSILVDDGRVLSRNPEEGIKNHARAMEVITKAGWRIQWSKTDGNPSQTVLYQGLINCTNPLSYFMPFFKLERIKSMIVTLIEAYEDQRPVPARIYAKVLGTINSGYKALGPISRVLLRSSHRALSSVVQPYDHTSGSYSFPDWSQHITVSKEVAIELGLLKDLLHEINGQPILTDKSGITLNSILEQISNESNKIITAKENVRILPKPRSGLLNPSPKYQELKVFASDSSGNTEFAYNVQNPGQVHFSVMDSIDQEASSGHRELKSILNCLRDWPEYFVSEKPTKIYWIVDSQNVYSWLTQGSRKANIQADIVQFFLRLAKMKLVIEPILVPREHQAIVQADLAGKFRDTDGWSIDDLSFKSIQQVGGEVFTCDVFAHSSNNRCIKFYSLLPSWGTAGINAFSMDWSKDYNFICPPVKEIIYVIRHIQSNPCRGVLVVPTFQGFSYWNFLRDSKENLIPIIKKTFTFCPDLYGGCIEKSSFNGPFQYHNITFVALFFNSH